MSDDGSKQHVILDRYFDEGERHWKLLGSELTNFHRTLSTYVRRYRRCGFAIEDLIEPTMDAADVEHYPELEDELRVPNFIIFILKKAPSTAFEPQVATSRVSGPPRL